MVESWIPFPELSHIIMELGKTFQILDFEIIILLLITFLSFYYW